MERSDVVHRLVPVAIKEANSNTIEGIESSVDILRYLKSLNLSAKRLSNSKVISPLNDLLDHENITIRKEVELLFTSWIKCFYSSGTNASSDCNKDIPKHTDVPKVCSVSKKRKQSQDIALDTKKNENKRPRTMKIEGCKSFVAKPIQKKKEFVLPKKQQSMKVSATEMNTKQSSLRKKQQPVKVSQKPKGCLAMKTNATEMNTKQTVLLQNQQPVKVSQKPKICPALEKNATEMLELFEIAKKTADVASAKGLLLSKKETFICVETLDLLLSYPISSTAPETRKIMEKLEYLTRHKDRKICNSASALLHHWRQSITSA